LHLNRPQYNSELICHRQISGGGPVQSLGWA
jgi:hypothetical protein